MRCFEVGILVGHGGEEERVVGVVGNEDVVDAGVEGVKEFTDEEEMDEEVLDGMLEGLCCWSCLNRGVGGIGMGGVP